MNIPKITEVTLQLISMSRDIFLLISTSGEMNKAKHP